jgi:opacity protein-like surface antigen
MKNLAITLVVLAAVMGLGIANASAEMYFSGNAGAVWVNDSDIDDGFDTGEISFDTGFGITAALGHSYGNGFRTEAELGFRSNDIDEISIDGFGSASIDGDISSLSFMVNGFYDFMLGNTFTPFVGAGIGFANVEGDIDGIGSEDDNVFAYQIAAGMAFPVNQSLKIDLQYRLFGTDDPDFDGLEAEYITHNLMIGFRQSF